MTISAGFDGPLHPLLWRRLPGSAVVPTVPRNPEEALGMMERSHAASAAHLADEPVTDGETVPLSQAWFAAVREACARTGPVPGVERYLLEWWVSDPPVEGLTQLPWLFGVWQGHWVCWAGTTPWAAADLQVMTAWDREAFEQAVRFGGDPEHPPTTPWTILGTSALAVPTVILLALAGKPADGSVRMPVTPSPAPEAEPAPAPAPAPIPPPPGAPGGDPLDAPAPVEPAADEPDTAPIEPADAEPEAGPIEPPDTAPVEAAPVEAEPAEPEAAPIEPVDAEPEAAPVESIEAETPEPDTEPSEPVQPVEPEAAPVDTETPAPDDEPIEAEAAEPDTAPVDAIAPIEPPPASAPALPPADWYPDPSGRHQLRFWDGSAWTEHAADQATGQVVDPI